MLSASGHTLPLADIRCGYGLLESSCTTFALNSLLSSLTVGELPACC
jgi:hypothetical protein